MKKFKNAGRGMAKSLFSNFPILSELAYTTGLGYRPTCDKEQANSNAIMYTNDLHEALFKKDGTAFWQCWRSKFNCKDTCEQVNSIVDPDIIVNKFSDHFRSSFC